MLPAAPAAAHGFAMRYTLPLPLLLYLTVAGAVVALSAVVTFVLSRAAPAAPRWPRLVLPGVVVAPLAAGVRLLGVALFALVVAAGLFGEPSPLRNIAPAFVWVWWWVGLAFVTALIGNLWPLLNPWASLYDAAAWAIARLRGRPPAPLLAWPEWLGHWPAVLLFTVFAWIEIVWPKSDSPALLAQVIIAYSAITWTAMALFGRRWLDQGEALSVAFAVFARFAPLAPDKAAGATVLVLRPWGAGLAGAAIPPSHAAFVVLMLASVTFDGFLETTQWQAMVDWLFHQAALAPALFWARDVFGSAVIGVETLALVIFPCLLLAVFLATLALMRRGGSGIGPWSLTGYFALTLAPIAIGYHFAHYLSFLAIAGQLIIPLASDPFGYGWDLFGTARTLIDYGLINTRVTWHVAIAAIVAGHVIAVVLAHLAARARGLRQLPLLALMVAYTVLSLWILAQPIVESPT